MPRHSLFRHLAAVLLVLPLAGCLGDPVEPIDVPDHLVGHYALAAVNDEPLPADIGFALGYPQRTEMLAGVVVIDENGRFVDVTQFRLYSPDGLDYVDFNDGSDGTIRLLDGGVIVFRPWGTSSYSMQYSEATDAPALVQQWNGFTLRYERVVAESVVP